MGSCPAAVLGLRRWRSAGLGGSCSPGRLGVGRTARLGSESGGSAAVGGAGWRSASVGFRPRGFAALLGRGACGSTARLGFRPAALAVGQRAGG